MLPNFVGIGVPRGGSTWLHELLESHPQAFVPQHAREIHFFDKDEHWSEGERYLRKFFPTGEEAERFRAVGEITPHYLYRPQAAERIRGFQSVRRLLLTLRDPVTRTISHHEWRVRMDGYTGDVIAFTRDYPNAVEWSSYAQHLGLWLSTFTPDELLILIFEEMFEDVPATRQRVAEHLGIDAALFPEGAGEKRVNAGGVPRNARLYRIAVHTARHLRKVGLFGVAHTLGRRLGLKKLAELGGSQRLEVSAEQKAELHALFSDDIRRLEDMLDKDLSRWRRWV